MDRLPPAGSLKGVGRAARVEGGAGYFAYLNLTNVYTYDILSYMKRTTIFLTDEDFEAIKTIQARYGPSTASEAIRLAVRILANAPNLQIPSLPKQKPKRKDS